MVAFGTWVNDHGKIIRKLVATVNEALCQGCGGCTVYSRTAAIDLKGFSNRQIMAEAN